MKVVSVLLADDHKMVTEALKSILEPAYEVLGIVTDGLAAVEAAPQLKPDIVILDIGMPRLNGLDAGRQIKKLLPRTKLLILTMNTAPRLIAEAFRSGFSAYLLKQAAVMQLLEAMHQVLRGGTYISAELGVQLADVLFEHPDRDKSELEITGRQRQIIQLLAEGRAMKEVADILQISTRTVADHKYRIMCRLGLKNNAEVYEYAVRHGMMPLQSDPH